MHGTIILTPEETAQALIQFAREKGLAPRGPLCVRETRFSETETRILIGPLDPVEDGK